MMRCRSLRTGALLLASTMLVTATAADVLDHARFNPNTGPAYSGKSPKGNPYDIHIDGKLAIEWEQGPLLAELYGEAGGDPEAAERLQAEASLLAGGVRGFFESEALFVKWKTAALRWEAANLDLQRRSTASVMESEEQEERVEFLRQRHMLAMEEFSDSTSRLLRELGEDEKIRPMLNEALVADDAPYDQFLRNTGEILRARLLILSDELAGHLADSKVFLYMTATLMDSSGRTTSVHLEGYDAVETGSAQPFDPHRFVIDERTLAELRSAELIADVYKDVADGTLRDEMEKSIRMFGSMVRELLERIRTDILEEHLNNLILELEGLHDAGVGALVQEARDARDLISSLADTPDLAGETATDQLVEVVTILNDNVAIIKRVIHDLPSALQELIEQSGAAFVRHGREIPGEIADAFTEARENFIENQVYFRNLLDRAREIASFLNLGNDVAAESLKFALPREIRQGVELDTYLNLETVRGKRYPGDRLIIGVRAVRQTETTDGNRTLVEDSQVFYLAYHGWYRETRGALIFTDPADELTGGQSWEPAPSLGYYWKKGIRGKPAWNRGLNPGFGFTFSLLDFDDERDFELGLAFGLTLYKDLFWIGYGRNIQAENDFFYLGINPMVITGLMRRGH